MGGVETGWSWLRIGTDGRHLWIRWWTFGFYKVQGISWQAAEPVSFSRRTLRHGVSKYVIYIKYIIYIIYIYIAILKLIFPYIGTFNDLDICVCGSLNPTQYKHKVLSESSTLFFMMTLYRSRLYCPIFRDSCCLRLQDEMSTPWPLPPLRPGRASGTLRRNLRSTCWESLVYTLVHVIIGNEIWRVCRQSNAGVRWFQATQLNLCGGVFCVVNALLSRGRKQNKCVYVVTNRNTAFCWKIMGRRIENFLSPFSANTGYVFGHTSINMLLTLCVRRL